MEEAQVQIEGINQKILNLSATLSSFEGNSLTSSAMAQSGVTQLNQMQQQADGLRTDIDSLKQKTESIWKKDSGKTAQPPSDAGTEGTSSSVPSGASALTPSGQVPSKEPKVEGKTASEKTPSPQTSPQKTASPQEKKVKIKELEEELSTLKKEVQNVT